MRFVVPVAARSLLFAVLMLVTAAGGHTAQRELQSAVFAQVRDDERHRQIMYIGPGTLPGSVSILTRYSTQEYDASGKQLQRARFPDELWLPVAVRFANEEPIQILGLKSGLFRSWIDLLDATGQRQLRMPGWQYGVFETADVLGDAEKEVLVRYENGVAVLDRRGVRLAFVRSPRYLYHFRSIGFSDSPKRAIAMWMWRDAKRGTDIAIYRADGRLVAEWNENPSDRFGVFALHDGEEGLWSALNDQFVHRSPTGQIRRSFDVPGMGHYRYVHGGALADGRSVLVGSAPGSTTGSIVCVFGKGGLLLARKDLPLQSWAFYIPDPNGTVFYVGSGEHVLRYDVASLP
jgi:hypothetical protein